MAESIERFGGGLLNVILGALILWVGQTTFRHSGILASLDEKFLAVDHQFTDVDKRQEGLKKWLDSAVSNLRESDRAQFTAKDGDKLISEVRQSELAATELERRVIERLGMLEARLAALETSQRGATEVATLRWEVAQLRDALNHTIAAQAVAAQQVAYPSSERVARGTPIYLPPVENRH